MADKKVFYAWQSDQPANVTRAFIREAIVEAIGRLNRSADVEDADDFDRLQIDHDTNGVPGSPPVAETICKKIVACAAFVADLTFVGDFRNAQGRSKKIVNGNVLVELGFARSACGFGRLITVQNSHFGSARELPFDLTHLRHPIAFELAPGASDDKRKEQSERLIATLTHAIGSVMDEFAQAETGKVTAIFKEYLADRRHEIRLRDILFEAVESVRRTILNQELQTSLPNPEAFRSVIVRYSEKSRPLLPLLALGGYWGEDYHARHWVEAIQRLANVNQGVGGLSYLLQIRSYPALTATYALGLGAVCRGNFKTLYEVLTKPMATPPPQYGREKEPSLILSSVWWVFEHDALLMESMFSTHHQPAFPRSAFLRKEMRPALVELLPVDSDFNEVFDRFEYLLALGYAQLDPGNYGPIGEFAKAWRFSDSNSPATALKDELDQQGSSHPLLTAGFFGGKLDKLFEAKRRLDEVAAQECRGRL